MTAGLDDFVLDNGLILDTVSDAIVICSAEPTALSLCSIGAANTLGYKSFGASNCFGAPGPGTPSGRIITSTSVTDGTIMTGGTANWWAAIDGTTRMHAHGSLSASQIVSSGNTFTLAAFSIRVPAGPAG